MNHHEAFIEHSSISKTQKDRLRKGQCDLMQKFPGGEFENCVGAEGDVLRAREVSRRNYLIGVVWWSALLFFCGPIKRLLINRVGAALGHLDMVARWL